MKHLSELLARFKKFGQGELLTKKAISRSINFFLNGDFINEADIKINNNTAFVKANSVLKNEIFLKKREILEKAKSELGSEFFLLDLK